MSILYHNIEDGSKLIYDPMRCPYEYIAGDLIHLMKIYLTPSMISGSLNTIFSMWFTEKEADSTEILYKYGWNFDYGRTTKFDWSNEWKLVPSYGANTHGDNEAALNSALKYLREISDICRENNIELILFTNPMHRVTYLGSVRAKDYFRSLKGLAEISDFWNFSSLNDITTNNANYIETSHYCAEVGDIMIDIMCSGKSYPELQAQGFGVKVKKENAKDFIEMLRRQAENYAK